MTKVTLEHDAAFVYDMLAIATIKVVYNPSDPKAITVVTDLISKLERQIGAEKHLQVVGSPEYADLYRVNAEMYVRIDELKLRGEQPGDAKYIDDRVYQRWLAKKNLQERHFGSTVSEQKFGYDKQ